MKAVIIADDDKIISRTSSILSSCGYDCIVYRWLLKALDNVEEIAPHLVVISTRDYPRHWKTFVQYISGLSGTTAPKVILYIDKDFSTDEQKKAQALGISGIFPAECSDFDFKSVIQRITTTAPAQNSVEKKTETLFIFTNPCTEQYCTGTVISFADDLLQFKPDGLKEIEQLKKDMQVSPCSLKDNGHIKGVTATVVALPCEENLNTLVLKIKG